MSERQKPTKLSDALTFVVGFAGFLWGGAAGSENPEVGFWAGALGGALLGAFAGKALGYLVSITVLLLVMAAGLALIALRVYFFYRVATGQ
jgi:hypothetical protein